MEEQELLQPLDQSYFVYFIQTLDLMFGGKYFRPHSKDYLKAKMTFEGLLQRKITVDDFYWVMDRFISTHKENWWQPAHILTIWDQQVVIDYKWN